MIAGGINRFAWWFQNQTTPSLTPGTSVTPGISNAEGSWTEIATAANIAFDVWGVHLWISGGNVNAQAKNFLLDLGDDPAAGTAYTAKISNLNCAQNAAFINGGMQYYFPLGIAAGSTVAARIQGSHATGTASRVFATFYGKPTRPEFLRTGRYTETIGTVTNSNGVTVAPGVTGAEGSWVSLGTTTKELWWWQLGMGINASATSGVVLTVAPTITVTFDGPEGAVSTDLTLTNAQINASSVISNGKTVAVGKAVLWHVTGGVAGKTYCLRVKSGTPAEPVKIVDCLLSVDP